MFILKESEWVLLFRSVWEAIGSPNSPKNANLFLIQPQGRLEKLE